MHGFKLAILLVFSILLGACADSDNKKDSRPEPTPDPEPLVVESFEYEKALTATPLGEELVKNDFKVPVETKDQSVTVSFTFNSGSADSLKVIYARTKTSCTGHVPQFQYELIKIKNGNEEVVEDNVDVVFVYDLEPNTNYAYRIKVPESSCSNIELGADIWTGSRFADPRVAFSCRYENDLISGGNADYFIHMFPLRIFTSPTDQLFGDKLICGETIDTDRQGMRSIGSAPPDIYGFMGPEENPTHTYEVVFDRPDLSEATYSCSRGDEIFSAGRLYDCVEKVLDSNTYEF